MVFFIFIIYAFSYLTFFPSGCEKQMDGLLPKKISFQSLINTQPRVELLVTWVRHPALGDEFGEQDAKAPHV